MTNHEARYEPPASMRSSDRLVSESGEKIETIFYRPDPIARQESNDGRAETMTAMGGIYIQSDQDAQSRVDQTDGDILLSMSEKNETAVLRVSSRHAGTNICGMTSAIKKLLGSHVMLRPSDFYLELSGAETGACFFPHLGH